MRVLLVSNLFPPRVIGGAEVAAYSWARWLVNHGHQVRVLTTAFPDGAEGHEEIEEGLSVERRDFGYLYSLGQLRQPSPAKRAVWHLQDHFNRSARRYFAAAVAEFQPDIVNCHDLQGLGYAVLREIAASGLPCLQTLHDFGFLCLNMAMFKGGAECAEHHAICRASAAAKVSGWAGISRLSFWSPSRALLERYRPHLPPHLEAAAIPYPLYFPPSPAPASSPRGPVRLLYVGQVTEIKGVAFLLGVLAGLVGYFSFHLRVVGGGAELEKLRTEYQDAPWVEFAGRVKPDEVGDFMSVSDLLVTPSLWFENSPLVVYQAIHLGLPVLASRTGGLPELIAEDVHGALAPAGNAAAWTACLRNILGDPTVLVRWRNGAAERREQFAVETVGAQAFSLLERAVAQPSLALSPA